MEENKYTKLSSLVDDEFTIEQVNGYKFKSWDNENKRMISEDSWFKGSSKKYAVETDKGLLDMSESQLGAVLVGVQHAGKADVIGTTVAVKSNGKTGIDIRYYLNPVRQATKRPEGPLEDDAPPLVDRDEQIDMDSIPF